MATERVSTTGYLVWHLSIRWKAQVDRALAPFGLTSAHYSLLASLFELSRRGGLPSQRELADFAGLEPMYVSKLTRSALEAGLLRRSDHPEDPRAFQLELTPRGRSTIVEAAEVVKRLYEELLAPVGGFNGKRNAELKRTLEALLDRVDVLDARRAAP